MTAQKVSVIIVSQGRPDHLVLCLESLRNQTYIEFEVIVVADNIPEEFVNIAKYAPFHEANIAAARNLGISNSSADIIAFCDDDAIPDPPWLERLIAPFNDPKIGSTTGFTRGRNGISRQWGALRFDRDGNDLPLILDETHPFTIFSADMNTPVKLLGTNMAIRKTALLAVGGFDEAFHFFLEDADIKLRLDAANWDTAIVPSAQVHHRFAASPRRKGNRMPTDLHEIGASKAHFCTKHNGKNVDDTLDRFRKEQHERLAKLMARRRLKQGEVGALLSSLNVGFVDGLKRNVSEGISSNNQEFKTFKTQKGSHILLCATLRSKKWMEHEAQALINIGHCVSVVYLTPTTLFFQVHFVGGYWLHKGGVWGKSIRSQPYVQFISYSNRFTAEAQRINAIHPIEEIRFKNSIICREDERFLT